MKRLEHQGILILPKHRAKGYLIIVNKKDFIHLRNDKAEEMAFAWCRKLGTPYVEDSVFRKNFFTDFCSQLKIPYTEEIDFESIITILETWKAGKARMDKDDKKRDREERRKLREKRKEKYGYAFVDKKKVEVSNYIAEPSCIFMGRGKHPFRGSWKEGPRKEDITLNLSKNAPRPIGSWKKIVWKPNKMWIASWTDKLSGKTKYVWLADTWGKKQEKEKAKFLKAKKLGKNLKKVEHLIDTGLHSSNLQLKVYSILQNPYLGI